MKNWSRYYFIILVILTRVYVYTYIFKFCRVLNLEKKKVEIVSSVINKENGTTEMDESSNTDEEFDEYLDWRSKKSFK